MVRAAAPSALHELRNPTSNEAQIEALKHLKNEIVGHDQRKELVIRHGVVGVLADILTRARDHELAKGRNTNGSSSLAKTLRVSEYEWSQNDEIRLQAILIIGSLTSAGPAYITPLLNGGVIQSLLESMAPLEYPSKLVAATLRTVNTLVDALFLDQMVDPSETSTRARFAQLLYAKSGISSFYEILSRQQDALAVRTEISLAAQLISKTCCDDTYRFALVKSSVLEALASQLATRLLNVDMTKEPMVLDLLEAIGTIIEGSNYRAAKFMYAKAINGLNPISNHASSSDVSSNGHPLPESVPNSGPAIKNMTQDHLGIPRVPPSTSRFDTFPKHSFPPPGALTSHRDVRQSELMLDQTFPFATGTVGSKVDFDGPILLWLMHIARKGQGLTRLAAIKVTTSLGRLLEDYSSNKEDHKARERSFALLLVPVLVKMIDEANNTIRKQKDGQSSTVVRKVLEDAPLVFARMICHSPSLQRSAVDAKAIPMLCQILKKTFDPIHKTVKPMWRADPSDDVPDDPSVDPASSTLGDSGLTHEAVHVLKVRIGVLEALAAIANKEDDYRKAIIEAGVMTYVTDALIPYQSGLPPSEMKTGPKDGNPTAVLISACSTSRAMSRSVGILRTSLIDCGIAVPIMNLLKHSDINVQIAATDVLCNLMLHFSPMRDGLLQSGVLRLLCENAHSANMEMRLLSLWALKHAVMQSDDKVKITCLEDLGTGWLIQALTGDREPANATTGQSRLTAHLGMGTSNAAGEQVDLLNAPDESSMDIDDNDISSEEDFDHLLEDSSRLDTSSRLLHPPRQVQFATEAELKRKLKLIKTNEMDPAVRARRDELRIQAQALDFVRNLIGEGKGNYELIDHILTTITPSRFFDILTAKLRPRSLNVLALEAKQSASQRSSSDSVNEQPIEIIISTIQVLNHIANGRPAQRSLIISQSTLLTLLLPFFRHPNSDIRIAMLWLNNNLTWLDDIGETATARQRALDLKNAGWENAVRMLSVDGLNNLDCKERAKTGVKQYESLLVDSKDSAVGQLSGGTMERGHRGLDQMRTRWGPESQ